MKYLLKLYNCIITGCYYLLYPCLYLYLKSIHYLAAINVKGNDSHRGILFHAASVGEVNAIKPLIMKIISELPEQEISITTTTLNGQIQAGKINNKLQVFLSALDIRHLRFRQLNKINPGLICIVETEIWPNMLAWANEHKVPVFFINARMSTRSFKRYRYLKWFIRYLEQPARAILAKSNEDRERFAAMFNTPTKYLGNLKLSLQLPDYDPSEIRSQWGFGEDDFILCWGSSRPGEEGLVLKMIPELTKQIPRLKLILAPRHPERLNDVQKLCTGLDYRLFSHPADGVERQILIIDKLGILDKAYAICDLAIVGGSFFDFGGHNPLEAAYYAKPVIIGPYHHSCSESVNILAENKAIIVSEARTLSEDIHTLAMDKIHRHEMGKRAKKVLTDNAKCVDKYFAEIIGIIGD